MSKYMRTVICLVLLATATLPMATQDAAICEALRAIHATHGDSLAAYLSEKGEDCLEPAEAQTPEQSPTVKPEKVEVWSASGNREFERSVTLELTKGLYRLNMIRGWSSGGRGYAWITEIISQPESCFLYESVTFPATLRIERDCKVYGTLETDLSSSFRAQTRSWALSITKESDMLPPVPNADGWSERGSRLHAAATGSGFRARHLSYQRNRLAGCQVHLLGRTPILSIG